MILAAALVGVAVTTSFMLKQEHLAGKAGLYGNGFAVVELFTSEGCSSCPPADALVARLQEEDKNLPVYILAFHVDYWDRLGWKDVFSDAAYTDRQRQYAAWLKLSTIYTPQVVVNGKKEFVGSNEAALRQAIGSSLQEGAGDRVGLKDVKLSGGHLEWKAETEATGGAVDLVITVVEHHATTQVKAGENRGRTVNHVQIVRGLEVVHPDGKGNAQGHLSWPEGLKADDADVVAFLQNRDSGKILAAARTTVSQ